MQQFESTPGSFRVCCRVCGSTAPGKAAYLTTVDIAARLLDASPDTGEISQFLYKGLLHVRGVFDSARLLIRKPFARRGCCFPANSTASAPRNSTRFADTQPVVAVTARALAGE